MNLSNVWDDQTNGVIIDLTEYTDWAWQLLLAVGDLNGDGLYNVLDIVVLANCVLSSNCG